MGLNGSWNVAMGDRKNQKEVSSLSFDLLRVFFARNLEVAETKAAQE